MKKIFRIVISASVLAIALIGAIFFVWPEYQEYSLLKTQIQTREARLENGERILAQLVKTQGEVLLHQEDFVKIDKAIPSRAGFPVLYEHIQQLGAISGLVLLSIESEFVEPAILEDEESAKGLADGVDVLIFKAEFAGSYEGLKNFLESAKKSARIFNVSTLDVSAGSNESAEGGDSGQLGISIELFAYELSI